MPKGMNDVVVSEGNSKMGGVPSISLPPVKSCGNSELCRNGCYALNYMKLRARAVAAYEHNLALYRRDPIEYFVSLQNWMVGKVAPNKRRKHDFNLFRFHVAGDIIDTQYLEGMALCAMAFPTVNFLCFTKMYDLIDKYIVKYKEFPINLSIVLSGWPGLEMHNPHGLPIAWMQDGTEDRVPDSAVVCHGGCESCGMCWQLGKLGVDVYFKKH